MILWIIYSTITSPPLQKHHHHQRLLSTALTWMKKVNESVESLLCYMTHWVVLTNWWWSQPSSLQVGCKWHWRCKVKEHVTPLRSYECAVRDFCQVLYVQKQRKTSWKRHQGCSREVSFRLRVCFWEERCQKETWNHKQRSCLSFCVCSNSLVSRKRKFYILYKEVGLY